MAELIERFTYSDGALPTVSGGAWTTVGVADIQVVSNRASVGTTAIHSCARALGFTPSGEWEIFADIECGTNTDDSGGPAMWLVDAGYNGYGCYVVRLHMGISEITGGVAADIATATATTGAGVNQYRLTRTSGGLLTMYRDGVVMCSVTDTTFSSPTQNLPLISSNDLTTPPWIDNLFIHDFISFPPQPRVVTRQAVRRASTH